MSVEYPIFAFEKDDHSMCLIEDEGRIFYHLEEADIRNGEYVFWDTKGGGVSIQIPKAKTINLVPGPAEFTLKEALTLFAKSKEIQLPETIGSPIEAWNGIQVELSKRPRTKGIVSRILSRFRT